ncbi:uncharacterized protein LOC111055518 [Nilaparvata lugens]|uniref:uncharacterized protein LOC111055518 n=1 Tax=Nilaparvata lugens TaxID=108931 RepID=UPI00193CFB20|nr:uncharacterized protein LOC111055518 [Nilaparvata lugens]
MADEVAASVNRVAVRIPPFWPADPELWFAQIENQFTLANITSDDTKFSYVAGNLDSKYAAEVRDILTRPPTTMKYEKLKTELIQRLSASQDQKTRQLLEHEEVGDRKPTQFLRHLRALAGTVVPDSVLKPLWLSRLPASTQAILATQQNSDFDALAVLADAVLEANPRPSISETAVATNSVEQMMERLTLLMTAKMGEIANTLRQEIVAVAEVQHENRSRRSNFQSSPHSRSRSASRSGNGDRDGICWYHRRFGDQADRCTSPCQYQPKRQGNDHGSH